MLKRKGKTIDEIRKDKIRKRNEKKNEIIPKRQKRKKVCSFKKICENENSNKKKGKNKNNVNKTLFKIKS